MKTAITTLAAALLASVALGGASFAQNTAGAMSDGSMSHGAMTSKGHPKKKAHAMATGDHMSSGNMSDGH